MILRNLILSLSRRAWVERLVRSSRLMRGVVQRFIAGDDLEDALRVAEGLVDQGYVVSLDFLGENVATEGEADQACEEYARLVTAIAASPRVGGWTPERINVSVKLSQLGVKLDPAKSSCRLTRLAAAALDPRNFIRVDMEESQLTDVTLTVVERAHAEHGNVGTVLQSMLKRTPADVERLIAKGMRVRLVKGAYLESDEITVGPKRETDAAYRAAAEALLSRGVYPGFATHDRKVIQHIRAYADAEGIAPGRFEFQMLYGIRRSLQRELLRSGYIVRVYVPYGRSWYPYFTRRLAERPANLLFFVRSLLSR
jgi:proline dehydrogenase